MRTLGPSALLSLIGVLLITPCLLAASVSSRLLTPSAGQGGERPHVAKRSMQSCSSSYTNYCLNQGQCMYLVDVNQHHCKCEMGYYGPRCANQEFLVQPMGEETILVIIFGVGLLVIGLSGLLYFCCKWHKKRRFLAQQKGQGYKGVRTT